MPRKNSRKRYYENGIYHVYNRGVEKRDIFLQRDDYLTFLHLLKTALSENPNRGQTPAETKIERYQRKNFYGHVQLLVYCLMPNHFHLLLKQLDPTAMTEFMRSICTSYGMYFNKKYKRVGPLFQSVFKAVDIEEDNYLLWVSRYIHRNPIDFATNAYSSYRDYLGKRNTEWLNTKLILDYFSSSIFRKINSYQRFVDDVEDEPIDLSSLILEDDDLTE
ncbi:MAG: hypothetical protein UY16_C0018G0008 [Candidatus Gottesmanbacteria bacterium GW2011_GWA2_47_9]|uniref:Transposase IS200-like domain-containing protein n=1 Tax=Candidatus Gottesmanbacteria bacterium GW2011_GWA2_47_9 TaxID=1618445 RepID=A0A0G1WBW3_9BACT|nr:MAG: hypothetical protein UY16_C0018G0008 [Candidatus Gottesmanbacteria bacterium GW2011_GWA2_47_9]